MGFGRCFSSAGDSGASSSSTSSSSRSPLAADMARGHESSAGTPCAARRAVNGRDIAPALAARANTVASAVEEAEEHVSDRDAEAQRDPGSLTVPAAPRTPRPSSDSTPLMPAIVTQCEQVRPIECWPRGGGAPQPRPQPSMLTPARKIKSQALPPACRPTTADHRHPRQPKPAGFSRVPTLPTHTHNGERDGFHEPDGRERVPPVPQDAPRGPPERRARRVVHGVHVSNPSLRVFTISHTSQRHWCLKSRSRSPLFFRLAAETKDAPASVYRKSGKPCNKRKDEACALPFCQAHREAGLAATTKNIHKSS